MYLLRPFFRDLETLELLLLKTDMREVRVDLEHKYEVLRKYW